MLGTFRGFLNTWPARLLFLVLASAFALWGVANKNPFGGDSTAVATVGGNRIEMPELQQAYRQQLAQVSRMMGGKADLPAEIRRSVAVQTVDQLVTQSALQAEARDLGLVVPDSALREAAFAIPQFRGRTGKFDRATMQTVLRQNGYTEDRFLAALRRDLVQSQLLAAVRAGAAAPDALSHPLFILQHETRTADAVQLPFAAAPAPPSPDEAQLRRWYDNHPDRYTSPEYRRIKAVILDPDTIAKEVPVSNEELRAAYDQHKAEYTQPERRTVQVLTVPDEAAAQALAAQWSTGSDWTAIQKAAQAQGATAVELAAATRAEFPAPELAEAAFATSADTVAPPVKGSLGWFVVKVVHIDAGGAKSFDDVRETLRSRLVADRVADLVDQRATQLDQDFASGTTLDDKLPGDLVAEAGTLDAQGMTTAGDPAPLRGSASLRAAMLAAAFQAHKGDPLKLQKAPPDTPGASPSYFALSVEEVIPPAPKPYEKVVNAVRADWTADARRHEQDAAATKLLTAVQGGASLADAASAAGLTIRHLPPASRASAVDGVPEKLVGPLFGLRQGQATMVETPDGFVVAVLVAVADPDPKADPVGLAALREQLAQSIAGDLQASFAVAVRNRSRPQINRAMVESLAQAGG